MPWPRFLDPRSLTARRDVWNIPRCRAPRLPQTVRQWYGSSRGRWEGNTLVVDRFPVAVAERRDLSGLSEAVDAREHMVARLGILGLNLTDRIRQILPAVRVATGVVVASTVAGATDSCDGGFAPGDVIYAVNRRDLPSPLPVSGLGDLRTLLEKVRIGDPVMVQLQRGGELMYLAFTSE